MSEEGRLPQEEKSPSELIRRYEQMVKENESYYFDVDEFELIIDHYLELNEVKDAEKVLLYANQLFPDNLLLMSRSAHLCAAAGKLTLALRKFKNLLNFEPKNIELHISLASVYSQLREHKLAISHFQFALDICEEDLKDELSIDLALEHENLEEWEKAISILKTAILRNPENEAALYEITYCFEMLEDQDGCIEFLNQFIDDHPYSNSGWYNLGIVHQRAGKLEKAIDAFDFCIAIQPDFSPAYFNKAGALSNLERFEECIACYKETLTFEQPQASTFCFMAECYERLEMLDKAEYYYLKSLEVFQHYTDSFIGLGVVSDMRGDYTKSSAYFKKALSLESDNSDYRLLYAASLRKMDKFEEANECYAELLSKDDKNIDVYLEYSDFLIQIRDLTKASEVIKSGIERIPNDAELTYRAVAVLFHCGEEKEAFLTLESAFSRFFEKSQYLVDYYPDMRDHHRYIELFNLYKND